MGAVSAASEVDYLIADGYHQRDAWRKHMATLSKFGGNQSMIKYLEACISGAEESAGVATNDTQRQVEQMRQG